MKIFKYLLFLILIVIIGGAVYFGTKDGHFDVNRTKTVEGPVSLVFEKANNLKQWTVWGPWGKNDPEMKVVFSNDTIGEGASYSWESEIEGNGSIITDTVVENQKIRQTIVFNTPIGDSKSEIYWDFSPSESGQTEVTWGMKGEQSFLEKVFMSFMSTPFETSLGQMFDEGLNNMNELVKDEMNAYNISIQGLREYGGGYYLYTTSSSTISEIGQRMGLMLGKVHDFATQNNITIAGMPFTIYNEVDTVNDAVIFSAALPINERIIINQGDVLCGYMEPLMTVKTVLKGNYTHLSEAYAKTDAYLAENNLLKNPAHPMFEIYANDPGMVPNPANWTTEIYVPVIREPVVTPLNEN